MPSVLNNKNKLKLKFLFIEKMVCLTTSLQRLFYGSVKTSNKNKEEMILSELPI